MPSYNQNPNWMMYSSVTPTSYSPTQWTSNAYTNPTTYPYGSSYNVQPTYDGAQTDPFIWVQGEAGALAYPIAKGATVMLMDANPNSYTFWIKKSDPYTGRPLPLEEYRYSRVSENQNGSGNMTLPMSGADKPTIDYIPKTEFDTLKAELDSLKKMVEDISK